MLEIDPDAFAAAHAVGAPNEGRRRAAAGDAAGRARVSRLAGRLGGTITAEGHGSEGGACFSRAAARCGLL